MSEGRSCPLAYRYSAEDLCQEPRTVSEDVLYIIGGLYGNPWALDEIEQMALAEERQGHRGEAGVQWRFQLVQRQRQPVPDHQ